ncbi:copper chaperone PCu(A)C [Corynebacterium sp. NPDC060344]|uniref:copper chaperone PCu(A)C n=1 Tax=Corynebacterium sp. NPDC060344 TaxID=3347101 RepID=UPI0036670A5B
MKLHRTTKALVAGSAAIALVLAGCSADDSADTTAANGSATTSADSTEAEASSAVTFEESYIKEKPADKEMTGIFGVLKNHTDEDLDLVSFRIEGLAEGTSFEQHTVTDGKMVEVEGGHSIPAGGEHEMAPGADHLMIMDNGEAMEQGEQYTLVLEFSDGSTLTQDIEVRVQPAGEEDYAPDGSLSNPGMGEDGQMTNMNTGDDEHAGH